VVRDFLIPTLTETLPVLSPGTVSTILGENWETGREQEQPPVPHPFHVTPPLPVAYAIRGSSTFTPCKVRLFSSGNFHPRHLSLNRRPTCFHHWTPVLLQQHRHTTTQLANSLLCHPTWSHTTHAPQRKFLHYPRQTPVKLLQICHSPGGCKRVSTIDTL